jgi:fumarate reductase flavoprotein subunit
MKGTDADVVVVGAGAAGLAAALTAEAEGARVVVAESEAVVGGAARLSGGMIMAAGTELQRQALLEDSADALYDEYMFINQFELQPRVARRLCDGTAEAISWLAGLGIEFRPDVLQGGPELVPRTHIAEGGGQTLIDVLHRRCRDRGVDIVLGRRVDRLLFDGESVVGVAVGGDELTAGAVVLAAGGFGANRSLIDEHLPSLAPAGDWLFYIGPEGSRGDALALAASASAATVGRDRFTALLVPRPETRSFDGWVPAWSLLVGPDGRRMCDETMGYGITCGLAVSAGGRAFTLFDEGLLAAYASGELPAFKPNRNGTHKAVTLWTPDNIRRLIASGVIERADTLEGLAERLGLPASVTSGAVDRYNQSARLGDDRDFGKDPTLVRALEHPPYYGAEIRPAALGTTSYGIQIDDSGRVLHELQHPIPGLFAAGECTGGVLGSRYLSSGNSLANSFVFGRVAGRAAAISALGLPGGGVPGGGVPLGS